jgi:TolA-binding protein
MARSVGVRRMILFGIGLLSLAGARSAWAQAPVSSDQAQITYCLCLSQGVATLSSDMSGKTQALAAVRQHLADLDGQLARMRPTVDVNNPDQVARYKALLEQRDAAYQQSIGPVVSDADQATARYNSHVNEYNTRCANHLFDSAAMASIQAHLSCPPLQ